MSVSEYASGNSRKQGPTPHENKNSLSPFYYENIFDRKWM